MTIDQWAAADHVSAATVQQVQVSRRHTMQAMDHEQKTSDDFGEHCGFLFPERESCAEHPGNLWTSYMGCLLAGPSENAVILSSDPSDSEHHAAELPESPNQGDLFAS
jgi:hypothetical protein